MFWKVFRKGESTLGNSRGTDGDSHRPCAFLHVWCPCLSWFQIVLSLSVSIRQASVSSTPSFTWKERARPSEREAVVSFEDKIQPELQGFPLAVLVCPLRSSSPSAQVDPRSSHVMGTVCEKHGRTRHERVLGVVASRPELAR